MVCHLDISPDGSVGLRVGTHSGVTAVEYKMDLDYRISFIGEGWKNILQTEYLHIGQVVHVIVRKCRSRHLQLMFMIEIINDLASLLMSELESDSYSESDSDSE
jgi:hypothetical protein